MITFVFTGVVHAFIPLWAVKRLQLQVALITETKHLNCEVKSLHWLMTSTPEETVVKVSQESQGSHIFSRLRSLKPDTSQHGS